MTAQVLFLFFFRKKTRTLMPLFEKLQKVFWMRVAFLKDWEKFSKTW